METRFLGFDHMLDVLKQDLAEGRIRPEQLSKVSIEQAVRRVHEYDQERKKAMAQASLKATEGMPVHKDYGDGFKWIELAPKKPNVEEPLPEGYQWLEPKNGVQRLQGPSILSDRGRVYLGNTQQEALEQAHKRDAELSEKSEKPLREALKYEGDTMGHCVGGYTDKVMGGHSRIFSLRDAKNEPHVTIEVQPKRRSAGDPDAPTDVAEHQKWLHQEQPAVIKQIYGKSNAKPKKQYIPYVQDFIRGGKWSDIKTLHNADMRDITKYNGLRGWMYDKGIEHNRYLTEQEYGRSEEHTSELQSH
mgnify:CR=1 FL=1